MTRASVVLALLLIPMAAMADNPPAVLQACVNTGNGMFRLVDADTLCHANETRVQWNVTGPQGPAGPAGPQGPAGTSAGGPPFVWVCTPANYFSASSTNASMFVFNGSANTANVAVHFFNKDGVNLAGVVVPGAVAPNPGDPAPTYPGQTGATTVSVGASNTLIVQWQTAQGNPAAGGNVAASVQVVSDQPVGVGANIEFSGFHPMPCSYVHP